MATISIILFVLANRVNSQTSLTTLNTGSDINSLSGLEVTAIFPTQIQQIQTTSETTLAVSAGNNLNDVGGTVPASALDVPEQNFQAISTIYLMKNKKTNDEKYARRENGNSLLDGSDGGNSEKYLKNSGENVETIKAESLVWDNCLETTYKDVPQNIVKSPDTQNDNHDHRFQGSKEIGSTSIWRKRDAGNLYYNSTAGKAWLEKYNNLLNAKTEERRQQKADLTVVKKITTTVAPTVEPKTTVQVIPITREVFKEPIDIYNTTEMGVTESDIVASYTEDWFEEKDRSKIRFGNLPQKEKYLIPALKLEQTFHPFGFMSDFFYLIYPFDFPVGLIKDIVWGEFTFPYSFLQSIKVESTFLAFIIAFACIALVIPAYLLILGILSLFSRSRYEDELETGALFPEAENSDCNDRALVVVTLFVVLVCCVLISGMAVSNEQARLAASDGRNVVSCACADIASWLSAAARELHHSLVPPVDLVLHAYKEDLKNVESLLGEPIQQAISSESGIDLVFDSLADIISESEDLSSKISSLRDVSIKAGSLASAASDRIKDLARQLENLKKHCTLKDTPLCDTINTHSLELKMKFDLILHEQQLLELRTLGVENLTRAISTARQEFKTLPSAILAQTTQVREDILRDIENRRQAVHVSAKVLSDIVRHLTSGLHTIARQLESSLERVQRYEFARWTLMLACIVTFGFVMMLIILGMLCGCGRAKNHARRTLKVSAIWLCLASLMLWGIVSAVFLIAGHAEVYVCHALWDSQYETLTALLDRPSPLLANNEGIFDAMFREMDNITIDVSVKDVLRDCEKDRPAYSVFQLDKILDVNKETSYFEWQELQTDFGKLASSIDVGLLKTISVNFSRLLHEMLIVSDVDIAKYRMDYNVPVVSKDLPSLVDQLENIAAQVTDLTTAGRLETLATRTQRLYLTNIKPLEQLRADVVFKLTELELQLLPFRRKLNISLSHIHTAQFYIDNQGDVIAQKKVSIYISRLVSHAAGWRTHVLISTSKHAARCKPLYSVYAAARSLLCSQYVSSLHGWWVCGFFLGISWCAALTPLCVKLWRSYGRKIRAHEAMTLANLGSGQQETPTTALCDGSNWNTPGLVVCL
ncbi:prominin-1-A isoform X2 [Spodoptera frugiperda]|uniref:Prominin-1-A isoform X2 n=1 Tax=Spodoptera frugiperda TaxID=7108 RepID=A0A9R0DEJ8_SPOFR|nr:prominin-1-A isoform X2 [Spodoptera frugiperda]